MTPLTTTTLRYHSTAEDHPPLKAATKGSAGLDIRVTEDYLIQPEQRQDLHTGLHVEIPKGHVGILVPRSSVGRKGLRLSNTVGVIDSDYRGEIILSCYAEKGSPIDIKAGDRIAQLLILPAPKVFTQSVRSLDELTTTTRGTAGFGSTGVR
jgi:dUTP pyrophosphatase